MLFTRKLITKFIPDFVNITDDRFVQVINALGMEVESITKRKPLEKVVIGELVSVRPVEGTHLSECEVKVTFTQTNKIVCGASGLKAGAKVIVALDGAKLPNGVTIAKKQIHGMESNGMMCAYSELIGNDNVVADEEQDEIIMLDEGLVGSNKWPELIGYDDTIYDITVPANRNDENSYLVFCYELANKLNLRFNFDLKGMARIVPNQGNKLQVNADACSFLSFLDYKVTPDHIKRSPWSIKAQLMNHGIKPINQLLDRLALITLLTNCPTHVYDADKLQGNLSCRYATGELKFVALNNKTYTLATNDVLICDQTQPVSIAAIIGSNNTKLSNKTTKAKIEVGNFNFAQVRTTSIRLNCETDASKKASRPLSNYLNLITLELIKKYLGTPVSQVVWHKQNWNTSRIPLDYQTLAWFIHEPLSKNFVVSSLKKLGYENSFFFPRKFRAPAWRLDVTTQEDMFEDILKIIDMNKLKPIAIDDNLLPIADNREYELKQSIKDLFLNNYFTEVKTYNLTNKNSVNKFNLFGYDKPVKIMSSNSNREYFRLNLMDGMLKIYKYNDARKLDLQPIFELQKVFTQDSKALNLTALATDRYVIDSITGSKLAINLNYFKSVLRQLGQILNTTFTFKSGEIKEFYQNETLAIINGKQIIGYMGKVKSSALKDYDLNNKPIYALSMNIDKLITDYSKSKFNVRSFGVFQRISKDVNIILDQANVHLVNQKIEQIKNIKDVADAKIINIFNKDNKTIYTVRYYLVDTRQFTTNDLEVISKQIENLSSL